MAATLSPSLVVAKGGPVPTPASDLPVPPGLQRGNHPGREEWIESGRFVVDVLCRTIERDDLAGVRLLDVGCGTKVVKTLLDGSLPIGRYVGIDVSAEVIAWLQANVDDARFEFHHLPARNDLYNPDGAVLSEFEHLPTDLAAFDLISLFSVFTHLPPDDFVAMLRLLRPHVTPDGRLVFSLFLDDPDHSSPYAEAVEAALASDDPDVVAEARAAVARVLATKDRGFTDAIPERPLLQARYERDFALQLLDGTDWEVLSIQPPGRYIQHSMVCRPV
jgi:SAM-dependent methyltransferase